MSAADCRCTSRKGVQADGFRPRLTPRHYKKRFLTPLLSERLTPALLTKAFRGGTARSKRRTRLRAAGTHPRRARCSRQKAAQKGED